MIAEYRHAAAALRDEVQDRRIDLRVGAREDLPHEKVHPPQHPAAMPGPQLLHVLPRHAPGADRKIKHALLSQHVPDVC